MLDRGSMQQVLGLLTPEAQEAARREAVMRGMAVEDVVLEKCLDTVQGQLYALRSQRGKPQLRVVEGGRA